MAKIIEPAKWSTGIAWSLECKDLKFPESGWGFPCDATGALLPDADPAAVRNLQALRDDPTGHTPLVIVRREWEERIPAMIQCDCGHHFYLGIHGADMDCQRCGATYNTAGQRLAEREHWGEETGESAADYDAGFAGRE
jgi:hypothetical protein